MIITLIDYGASNIRSVQKALEHIGAQVAITNDPEQVVKADKLILPGVGAFGSGMAGLRQYDLPAAIKTAVQQGTPFLGICVGMQLMFSEGYEMGVHEGLDVLAGNVVGFNAPSPTGEAQPADPAERPLKVPHMGWNQLTVVGENPLLRGVATGDYVYFVHSYYCQPVATTAVIAWTEYGRPFAAAVAHDNCFGVQFHPEKSQSVGLRILQNFVDVR